jgi:hypothetical protein
MMRRTLIPSALVLVGAVALVVIGAAGSAQAKKPALSATPVFKLHLKPSQEVPPIKDLKASAVGSVTFDLTRNAAGTITAGEVIFYFNYSFPGSVTISGLHVHQEAKGVNGPIVVSSGVATFTDLDGAGNVTAVVTGTPAVLQGILDNPRGYYVNLHTTTPAHPGGALRQQMHNPKKR